jgi:feruloyl esterase
MRKSRAVPVVVCGALLTAAAALASDKVACAVKPLQGKAPADTTIISAAMQPAAGRTPAHCLVKATVATSGNNVELLLALPDSWNAKFMFEGVGGFAGSMGKLDAGLERGYATATTDTGHQGKSSADAGWALNNRPKEIDYGHRGTHVATVAAKAITSAYFGEAPRYGYFNGCSNGGRQALMEVQRYPRDYDGLIAGDPSVGTMDFVRGALTFQFMLAAPGRALPPAKIDLLTKAALAACDKNDGVSDGLISDPRVCKFDPSPLKCKDSDADTCLTAAQLEMVKFLYEDHQTPDGDPIYGAPVGHEAGKNGWPAWITGRTLPTPINGALSFGAEAPNGYRFTDEFFRYLAFDKDDASYDWTHFDMARDLPKLKVMADILDPVDPDLSKFAEGGGKLLVYHGWADPAVSAYSTLDYFDKVVHEAGGKQKAAEFMRLFMVPGMHHCSGGPGPNTFDTLTAMEEWVEKGTAPAQLIASHSTDGSVDRTRPLCPEPQVARYSGKGSIDEAANFICETPR